MIVADASVLIAHLDATDQHHQLATALLLAAAHEEIGASPLTLSEVLVGPALAGQMNLALTTLKLLHIRVQWLREDGYTRLAMLRAETGLKLPDCCVLLAAEAAGASLATFDRRLGERAQARGLSLVGVR